MDTVCKGITFVFVYLDDILVGIATADDHVSHLRTAFERLASHGLVINLSKCQIGTPTIDYLGHHITRPAEQKYSDFDRELLAMYLAIRHLRYFLEGRTFTLYTDHKPLTFAIAKVSDP